MATEPDIKQWADKLNSILQRAAAALAANSTPKIVSVQKELSKFIDDSPDYADALDHQASAAIYDLDLTDSETAAENIRARASEVYKIIKLISGISAEANSKAAVLGGKLVIEAIDAATVAIQSFRKLRDELSPAKPDEKAVATEIDKTLAAIQTLRSKLEIS